MGLGQFSSCSIKHSKDLPTIYVNCCHEVFSEGKHGQASLHSVKKQKAWSKQRKKYPLPNPDPNNYQIVQLQRVGAYVVVKVHYPDCTNYEGNKIMIFENVTVRTLRETKILDPHFCDSGNHISPIARFAPTKQGWKHAVNFCKSLL